MADVIGGHIPMAALSIGSGMPGIQGGKLRGLAVTSLKRSPALPDVPTLDEAGLQGLRGQRLARDPGAQRARRPRSSARLNAELTKAMQNAGAAQDADRPRASKRGPARRRSSPRCSPSDTTKWHKIVETAGIKAE